MSGENWKHEPPVGPRQGHRVAIEGLHSPKTGMIEQELDG
jgi:hypothetical protein